jgi:protein-tyrosine kinase
MGRIADALKKADDERAVAVAEPRHHAVGSIATHREDPSYAPDGGTCAAQPDDSAEAADSRTVPARLARLEGIGGTDPALVTLHVGDPVLIEQYRALRTRLLSQVPKGRSQVIAITSSLASEGKSVTTANLGLVMAEVRHLRVLLVDGDFRRTRLASLFGMKNHPGLIEVLRGESSIEDVVQQTPAENLHLIPAGETRGVNPAELLTSKRAGAVFDELRDRYNFILVDTPPCADVADAGMVGQVADSAVMIVRLGRTPQPAAQRIVQMLRASKVNLMGCVLVGSEETRSPYSYDDGGYRPGDDGT